MSQSVLIVGAGSGLSASLARQCHAAGHGAVGVSEQDSSGDDRAVNENAGNDRWHPGQHIGAEANELSEPSRTGVFSQKNAAADAHRSGVAPTREEEGALEDQEERLRVPQEAIGQEEEHVASDGRAARVY